MKEKKLVLFKQKTKHLFQKRGLQGCNPLFFEHKSRTFKNTEASLLLEITRKVAILFIFSLVFCLSAFSQIQGTIRDISNKEALPGANVFCKKLVIGTTTDKNGHYYLNMPTGTYTLQYSFLGYDTQEKEVVITNTLIKSNIYLKESSHSLEGVVVIAKSEARKVREQAMPVSVIQMDKIQGTVNGAGDIISKTVGVTMRNSGGVGSTSRISVRGLEGKRIGIFVEGLPISENNDYNSLNAIPVDAIERIEIYKGIVPAKFGGSAIGGAVNIVKREYPPYYCELEYTQSSFNTHIARGGLKRNFPEKGYMLGLAGSYLRSDNNYIMELPLRKGVYINRDHDVFEKKFVGISFSTKKWWFDEMEIEPAVIFNRKQIQGIEYNIQKAEQETEVYSAANRLTKKNFLLEGLDFEAYNIYAYSKFQFTDTSSYRYKWDMSPYIPASKFGGEIGTDANATDNRAHTFTQRTNLNYIINQYNAINFNSQYNFVKGMPSDTLKDTVLGYKSSFNSKMNSWIGGISHEFNSSNKKFANMLAAKFYYYSMNARKLKRISSSETEHIRTNKFDIGFSNAFRYRITPTFLVKASLAYDVRLPNEQELLGDGFLIAPATELKPEQNKSINLSFMYDKYNAHKRFQVEMNVFYMKLTNMIRFTGGMLQFQYQNFGEMRTIGTELDVKWDATNWLYLFGNATYQDLRDTRKLEHGNTPNPAKGDRMPNIPYLMANAGLELHKEALLGNKSSSRLYASGSFIEEYYYDFKQSNMQERKLPRSLVFNMGLEHTIMDGGIVLGFQLNNLTNKKILSEFNRPLPGRNYAIKIRYVWKKR